MQRDDTNLYWKAALTYAVHDLIERRWGGERPVQIFAEVYGAHTPNGKRVQDLTYNPALGLRIAVFEIAVDRGFLPYAESVAVATELELPFVPLLYSGPFEREATLALAEGRETISGSGANIREGIVIRPVEPRDDPEIGRVVLKHVGASYLTRKGDVTEYS